jgi:hypothetical protein
MNRQDASIPNTLALVSDPERFDRAFTSLITNKLSYFDFDAKESEQIYHSYIVGMLTGVGIPFASKREGGYGRYDIMALLPDKTIIFEFKRLDAEKEDTPQTRAAIKDCAKDALKQIVEKNYAADAPKGRPVYAVGIGFLGKMCAVLSQGM